MIKEKWTSQTELLLYFKSSVLILKKLYLLLHYFCYIWNSLSRCKLQCKTRFLYIWKDAYKKNCNKNITLFKNARNSEIATKFTASKSWKVLLPLPTVCIFPFPYSISSTQNKAIKKVIRQFQVRLVSSISSSRELISTRVCWTGNRGGEGSETSSFAALTHCVCSGATEISSKRALYPRNTTTGRAMARAFPFAKYFHCVGSNRKEGEKKRKNYLPSNFNCPVGKWGKKSIKKTYMSGM